MAGLDLRQELDRSFGDGPEHRPLDQRIAAGRRSLVRRRAAAAVAALAVVVAVGGTAWALVPGDATSRGTEIATQPSATPTTAEAPWEDDTPVRYVDGEVQVRPGVVVHRHIDNPYGSASRPSSSPPRTAWPTSWSGRSSTAGWR